MADTTVLQVGYLVDIRLLERVEARHRRLQRGKRKVEVSLSIVGDGFRSSGLRIQPRVRTAFEIDSSPPIHFLVSCAFTSQRYFNWLPAGPSHLDLATDMPINNPR